MLQIHPNAPDQRLWGAFSHAPGRDRDWLYVRIYCEPELSDDVVINLIRPAEQELRRHGWVEHFFFIRYIEGGYHLRLRFFGQGELLQGPVRRALNGRIEDFFAERGFALAGPQDRGPSGQDDPFWRPRNDPDFPRPKPSYEYDRYEPEKERYGGSHGLWLSEQHFEQSSYTALHILEMEKAGAGPRQNAALLLLDATARAFSLDAQQRQAAFERQFEYWAGSPWIADTHLEAYARMYEQYRVVLPRLVPASDISCPEHASRRLWHALLEQWHGHAEALYQHLLLLESQGSLSASPLELLIHYSHMLCNRLGIFPREEAALAYLLSHTYTEQLTIN